MWLLRYSPVTDSEVIVGIRVPFYFLGKDLDTLRKAYYLYLKSFFGSFLHDFSGYKL